MEPQQRRPRPNLGCSAIGCMEHKIHFVKVKGGGIVLFVILFTAVVPRSEKTYKCQIGL
jgi:hypothetical protein